MFKGLMLRENTVSFLFSIVFLFGYGSIMAPPSCISVAASLYVVYLMDISTVRLIDIVFFDMIVVCNACKS